MLCVVACRGGGGTPGTDITRRADDAVSEAERFGRNRVVVSGHARFPVDR